MSMRDLKNRYRSVVAWVEVRYLASLQISPIDAAQYMYLIDTTATDALKSEFTKAEIKHLLYLKKIDSRDATLKGQLAGVLAEHMVKRIARKYRDKIANNKELEDTVQIVCSDGTWYIQHKHSGQSEEAYERTLISPKLALSMLRAVSDVLNELSEGGEQ